MSDPILRPLGPDDVHPGSFGIPDGGEPLWVIEHDGRASCYGSEKCLRMLVTSVPSNWRDLVVHKAEEIMSFRGIPIKQTDSLFNL